jgi:hypothetical protein
MRHLRVHPSIWALRLVLLAIVVAILALAPSSLSATFAVLGSF